MPPSVSLTASGAPNAANAHEQSNGGGCASAGEPLLGDNFHGVGDSERKHKINEEEVGGNKAGVHPRFSPGSTTGAMQTWLQKVTPWYDKLQHIMDRCERH